MLLMAIIFGENVPKYGTLHKSCSLKHAEKFQQIGWWNRTESFAPFTLCWSLCALCIWLVKFTPGKSTGKTNRDITVQGLPVQRVMLDSRDCPEEMDPKENLVCRDCQGIEVTLDPRECPECLEGDNFLKTFNKHTANYLFIFSTLLLTFKHLWKLKIVVFLCMHLNV